MTTKTTLKLYITQKISLHCCIQDNELIKSYSFVGLEEPARLSARECDVLGWHLSSNNVTTHQDVHLILDLCLCLLATKTIRLPVKIGINSEHNLCFYYPVAY